MIATGTRGRFTRTSYLLKVQVETYKVQSRTLGKVDQLYYWYQGTRTREQGTKGDKGSRVKGELA